MEAAETLRIALRPSRRLAFLLGFFHALAIVSAGISLNGWAQYLVAAGVLLSAAGCLAEVLLRRPATAVSLELRADGSASWRESRGTWREGRLEGGQLVWPALVILGIKQARRRRKWIVLMPDSAPADDLKRLRVWLRWQPEARLDRRKPPAIRSNPPTSP